MEKLKSYVRRLGEWSFFPKLDYAEQLPTNYASEEKNKNKLLLAEVSPNLGKNATSGSKYLI